MNEPLFFDRNEFSTRLFEIFGEKSLVEQILMLSDQYYYCLNLVPYNDWSDFFKTKKEFIAFKKKHQIPHSINVYYPYKFENIIMETLDLTREKASEFTKCEEKYLFEIGAI